jgi:hypothetical protein
VTSESTKRLGSFAIKIGWTAGVLSNESSLADDWLSRLGELEGLFDGVVDWTSDAVGTVEYRETGEKWLAEFKTFIDKTRIWRLYERVHPDSARPRFKIARRNIDLIWEEMGYFNSWPDGWKMKSGSTSILRQMVTSARSNKPSTAL